MKLLTIFTLLTVSLSSFANVKTLKCNGGRAFLNFQLTLDPYGYAEGSGYYHPIGGSIVDNYTTARVICYQQNDPGAFNCVGYWFDIPAMGLAEIAITPDANGIPQRLTYTLRGRTKSMNNCTLE